MSPRRQAPTMSPPHAVKLQVPPSPVVPPLPTLPPTPPLPALPPLPPCPVALFPEPPPQPAAATHAMKKARPDEVFTHHLPGDVCVRLYARRREPRVTAFTAII